MSWVIICSDHVTSSNGNIFCVASLALCEGNAPGIAEFPSQRPVTLSFDVFFDLRLNKRSCKQSRRPWIETPSRPLWRYCNVKVYHQRSLKPLPKLMLTTNTLETNLETKYKKKCKHSSAKLRPFCSQCVMKLGHEVGIAAQGKGMECTIMPKAIHFLCITNTTTQVIRLLSRRKNNDDTKLDLFVLHKLNLITIFLFKRCYWLTLWGRKPGNLCSRQRFVAP